MSPDLEAKLVTMTGEEELTALVERVGVAHREADLLLP